MATVTRRLAALLGASGAGLTDSATSSQITTTSLKDDAVTSAKIGTDQVGADALSSSAIAGAADIPANSVGESELSIDLSAQSVPHIIPGVLQPAIAGKLLNGADHSGAYGTAQTQTGGDGHKYYYTDIKGSKPIKDPRIGAYFGSQRHKFKSLQLLEQETTMHGKNVYSVDGREWIRAVEEDSLDVNYDAHGNLIALKDEDYIEIVGYFNNANFSTYTFSGNTFEYKIDGGSFTNGDYGATSETTPLGSRYVDASSFVNLGLSVSLGIHTLRIKYDAGGTSKIYAVELIAQDLSGSGSPNRSKIKFPAQNVVSFGKKFPITETNHHYDPFTTMSYGGSGTTLSNLQSLIDKDTSLGLDNWKAGTANYHRPWNGGRVVKWVDSDGTIKTSVTMMPPNAQNIGTTASSDGNNGDTVTGDQIVAGTNDDTINFNTSAIDHSLSEVAKTFHIREFGNGSANGGTGSANYADASMITSTTDDIAYVMDDGSTSYSGNCYGEGDGTVVYPATNSSIDYLTFIGTGITIENDKYNPQTLTIVQNLPFGTHVLKGNWASGTDNTWTIDGVAINLTGSSATYTSKTYVTFHQPKRPPIPEDCVVLADYMLMADFVPQASGGVENIPKGVRFVAQSKDYKIDYTAGSYLTNPFKSANPQFRTGQYFWYKTSNSSGDTYTQELPFFGDSFVCHFATQSDSDYANPVVTLNGSALSGFTNTYNGSGVQAVSSAGVIDETGSAGSDNVVNFKAGAGTLGSNVLKVSVTSNAVNKYLYNRHFSVATPIHTSSHYQTFESPFLHELVGGDRNMEQTNLICSPDGKTWDEVTRDTSYLGGAVVSLNGSQGGTISAGTAVQFKLHRGVVTNMTTSLNHFIKENFVMGFDRLICLIGGQYEVTYGTIIGKATAEYANLHVNGVACNSTYSTNSPSASYFHMNARATLHLKRGDYLQVKGGHWDGTNTQHQYFIIENAK